MSLTKKFGDHYVALVEDNADDEYQASIEHKSNTVAVNAMYYGVLVSVALLAWGLPSELSLYSLLPIVVFAFLAVKNLWMRNYAPTPRPVIDKRTILPALLLLLVALAGWAFNIATGPGADSNALGSLGGSIVGSVIGVSVALIFTPRILHRQRKNDEERFNREIDAED